MATKIKRHAPQKRRTNVERTAETRGKLIAAAIDALYQCGYSSATTIEVAKRARVSRGAMLHQFPTRVELLLAVAQHIVDSDSRYRHEHLSREKFATALERFYAAADVSWTVHTQPSTIALLEIMMATRSDSDLRKGFAPFLKTWRQTRRDAAARMAADLGVENIKEVATLIGLHQASMRGLAIELMFTRDPQEVESARHLLARFDRMFAEKLVASAKIKHA
jgi:AcrR family transcriptional regulator